MYTPEKDSICKICMGHQYNLTCTGYENCGIHADIEGTLLSQKEAAFDVFGHEAREQAAREIAKREASKKQSLFDSAARAYNRGEGFIQFSPVLGLSWFTYEGHDWDLEAVSQRAYEIR